MKLLFNVFKNLIQSSQKMPALTTQHTNSLQNRYDSSNKVVNLLVVIFLLVNFILLGISGINNATNPESWDTTAYLGEANFIKNNGGWSNFLNLCFSGDYKQANQHPLYILLLVPIASTNISFFITAKLVSFLIGLIFLLIVYFVVKKMAGNITAAIVVSALLLNVIFIQWTTEVACESLLMLFSFLTLFFVHLGFEKNKNWVFAGFFAGLAYLTKGTSLILLPGFLISALIIYRTKIFKNKYFWSFFLLFFITASPLLIRNVIVYKNPFFNVNNYIITLGVDYLDENRYVTYSPNEGATLWKFDKIEGQDNSKESKGSIIPKLIQIPSKMLTGIKAEASIFLDSFNILQQNLSKTVLWITGIIFSLLFFIGILREKNKAGKIYLLLTIIIFILFLSFNPIDRYFLPLTAFIWIYIAFGLMSITELASKKLIGKSSSLDFEFYFQIVLLLFLIFHLSYTLINKPIADPMKSVYCSLSRTDILDWLRSNLKEDEKYTLGPNLNWQLSTGIWILPPYNAKTKDFQKFKNFIAKHNVSYIIIDTESLSDKMKLIENIFIIDPIEGLIEKKSETGWMLIYKDKNKPVDYLIYKLNDPIHS